MSLTGRWRVRIFRPAFCEVRSLCKRVGDQMEIRRQALKLKWWPSGEQENGQVVDLNWEFLKTAPGEHVGELRIDDEIAGHDNLRVIFYRGDPSVLEPLPMIWILCVMQKKRDYFTTNEINVFLARKKLVVERFYKSRR